MHAMAELAVHVPTGDVDNMPGSWVGLDLAVLSVPKCYGQVSSSDVNSA